MLEGGKRQRWLRVGRGSEIELSGTKAAPISEGKIRIRLSTYLSFLRSIIIYYYFICMISFY